MKRLSKSTLVFRVGGLIALALTAQACKGADGDEEWELSLRSPHFRYFARSATGVCPAIMDAFEHHLTGTHELLGLDWRAGRVITYFAYRDAADFESNGPAQCRGAPGCFDRTRDRVYASRSFDAHELVHAYTAPLGRPHPLYVEGIAEALGCAGTARPAFSVGRKPLTWREAVALRHDHERTDAQIYAVGHHFIRHLLDRYGPATFIQFYRGARYVGVDPGPFQQEFEAFFPDSLDQVWTAAMDADLSQGDRICPCNDATPIGATGATPVRARSCERYRPFALSTRATVAFDVDADRRPVVMSCSGRLPRPGLLLYSENEGPVPYAVTRLEAGTYYLSGVEDTSAAAVVALPDDTLARSCEEAKVWTPPDPAARPFQIGPPDAASFTAFSVPQAYAAQAVIVGRLGAGVQARLCRSCREFVEQPSACLTIGDDEPVRATLQGQYVLGWSSAGVPPFSVVEIAPAPGP